MSRERPLLMRGPLVVASLEGRKTQTRRVLAPSNSLVPRGSWPFLDWSRATVDPGMGEGQYLHVPSLDPERDGAVERVRCRWIVGDRLVVREAWQTGSALDDEAPSMLAAWAAAAGVEPCGPVRYMGDGTTRDEHLLGPGSHYGEHWGRGRPGIHMPRWASRLVLAVTEIRVQRVQSISEDDARAEGLEAHDDEGVTYYGPLDRGFACPRMAFRALWDGIHGPLSDNAWADNPWTWAISYHQEPSQP